MAVLKAALQYLFVLFSGEEQWCEWKYYVKKSWRETRESPGCFYNPATQQLFTIAAWWFIVHLQPLDILLEFQAYFMPLQLRLFTQTKTNLLLGVNATLCLCWKDAVDEVIKLAFKCSLGCILDIHGHAYLESIVQWEN